MKYSNDPVNRALKRLMQKHNLSDAEAHRRLGIYTPAAIGNYRRGNREVPTDFILKWEKVFGEKLLEESKTTVDTNVSRETNVASSEQTKILPLDVWEELKINNEQFRRTREDDVREKNKLLDQNSQLIEIFLNFSRGGMVPHKS